MAARQEKPPQARGAIGIAWIWKPFVVFDLIFLVLFLVARKSCPW